LQLAQAVKLEFEAAGADEVDAMWIEFLVPGLVRLRTFTPHSATVLAPVVLLLPVYDAQRFCE
jgi:hypothetical protein